MYLVSKPYLRAKWWIRFNDPTVPGQWKDILLAKYGNNSKKSIISSFWKAVIKDREKMNWGLKKIVGNGRATLFWLDRWIGECALKCVYPQLFQIATKSD